MEKVFRDTLAKDKDEFTLAEFKKLVPSKNVSEKNNVWEMTFCPSYSRTRLIRYNLLI